MNYIARTTPYIRVALSDSGSYGLQRMLAIMTAFVLVALTVFSVSGCSGGGSSVFTSTVAAAGAPTNFAATQTANGVLSVSLSWQPPASGGAPASYEVYRGTSAGTAFQAANHLISIASTGNNTYSYVDNAGLSNNTTYYYTVSAKNAGGETPAAEKSIAVTGAAVAGFGNNFSSALIFADDIGIGGAAITGTGAWTAPTSPPTLPTIDYNTGLRPLSTEAVATLPYFDPATEFVLNKTTYYKQQTASTWQGEWAKGASTPQNVVAKWGDNLVSQSLTANSVIRVEMVLSKTLTTPMTSYTMKSLYGAQANEIQGTDGTTYLNSTALVYATNARLTIQKMDGATNPVLLSQPLWTGDGPGFLAGEINVSGNFTYGFVWNLKSQTLPSTITSKTGTWRLTFSLDPNNSAAVAAAAALATPVTVPNANNNTFIDSAANGVYDSANEVHIDIVIN